MKKWIETLSRNSGIRQTFFFGDDNLVTQFVWVCYRINGQFNAYGLDVGYHSKTPLYDNQKPMSECKIMKPCYYDGSSLQAEGLFEEFLVGGEEVVWQTLESRYNNLKPRDLVVAPESSLS